MKPQHALSVIPGFQDARLVRQIAAGVTADSWQVELDEQQFVLRVDRAEAHALGLDREGECEVQAAVARAGLSPAAVFSNPKLGISLRPWVAGHAWSAADLNKPANLERLGGLLRRLHELPPCGPAYRPGKAARRYADQLGSRAAQQMANEANKVLSDLKRKPVSLCLCHNDLVAENLVDAGDRLVPIDWEYAGMGDPLFDLAVLMQHHKLEPAVSKHLMQAYFKRDPTSSEALRIKAWCGFYKLLLILWQQRVDALSKTEHAAGAGIS